MDLCILAEVRPVRLRASEVIDPDTDDTELIPRLQLFEGDLFPIDLDNSAETARLECSDQARIIGSEERRLGEDPAGDSASVSLLENILRSDGMPFVAFC